MTDIREPNFEIDLPGDWSQVESNEDGATIFERSDGTAGLTVLLLSVRPLFAIADQLRLLDDYLHHRSQFEKGRWPALEQSEPVATATDGASVGEWSGFDPATGRRIRHRVLLVDGLLGDFSLEADDLGEAEFDAYALPVLATARVQLQ